MRRSNSACEMAYSARDGMAPATPPVARRHGEIDRGLCGAAGARGFACRDGVLEAFSDPVERYARVAASVGRNGGDRLLQLIEACAPLAQLSLHRVDSRRGVDGREAFGEVALERVGFVEVFLNRHEILGNREWGIGNRGRGKQRRQQ